MLVCIARVVRQGALNGMHVVCYRIEKIVIIIASLVVDGERGLVPVCFNVGVCVDLDLGMAVLWAEVGFFDVLGVRARV